MRPFHYALSAAIGTAVTLLGLAAYAWFDFRSMDRELDRLQEAIEARSPAGELPPVVDGQIVIENRHNTTFDFGGRDYAATLIVKRCTNVVIRDGSFQWIVVRSHSGGPQHRLRFIRVGATAKGWDFNRLTPDAGPPDPPLHHITLRKCWSVNSIGQGLWAKGVDHLVIRGGLQR